MEGNKPERPLKWGRSGGKILLEEATTHIKNCLNARASVLYSERRNWLENKETIERRGKKQRVILHLRGKKRLK